MEISFSGVTAYQWEENENENRGRVGGKEAIKRLSLCDNEQNLQYISINQVKRIYHVDVRYFLTLMAMC